MGDLVNITGFNLLPEVAAQMPEIASKLVRKAAFDIAARAISGPPRKTGFMKGSIYVAVHSGDNEYPYPDGLEPDEGDGYMLDEVQSPNDLTAIVAVGANYGVFVELGTRYMSAQPYLTPAAEIVRPQYLKAMEGLTDLLEL